MAEAFLSEIRIFGFAFPPRGWALCNGQLLPIAQNQALFALLGTTYGGNGTTNFALPDLRGRVPMNWGAGPGLSSRTLGEVGGSSSHTLITSEVPSHNHVMSASTLAPNQASVTGGVFADNPNAYIDAAPNAAMGANALLPTGGQPHENMMPYLAINYSICIFGIFPSQN
ncbi:MAG TPA: tail fiber protein [Pyrinomonadaceae bacterium]|nr:tail fiber protein [Pyrinomonadaceae bacterium]